MQAFNYYRGLHKFYAPPLRTPIHPHPLTRSASRITYRPRCRIILGRESQSLRFPPLLCFRYVSTADRGRLGRTSRLFMWHARDGMTSTTKYRRMPPLFSTAFFAANSLTDTNARRLDVGVAVVSLYVTRLSNSTWETSYTRNRVRMHSRLRDMYYVEARKSFLRDVMSFRIHVEIIPINSEFWKRIHTRVYISRLYFLLNKNQSVIF